jgi:hypothetical protein
MDSANGGGTLGGVVARAPPWRERAMWWILMFIVLALIVGMVMALNRRGPGDPSYRPKDPRSGEKFKPGGGGAPGDGVGF